MTKGQIELERRLGMTVWEIREKILDLPNDERWAYMSENQISGSLVFLAPSQYPKRPAGEMEIQEGRCHQMTIDEWLGLAPEDPGEEIIREYINAAGYTIENMERKIAYEFKSYQGGCWARLSFDFSCGKAMFSRKIFSGYANRKKPEPGVYIYTKEEYKKRVRRILKHEID